MKQELLTEVLLEMREYVDNGQLKQLEKVLKHILFRYHVTKENKQAETSKNDWIELFIAAKRIEGCSAKTLAYYRNTIDAVVEYVEKDIVQITTDDIRKYLMDYQNEKGLSKVTVDNIRRILSSFFAWLEEEDYILKSPVRLFLTCRNDPVMICLHVRDLLCILSLSYRKKKVSANPPDKTCSLRPNP